MTCPCGVPACSGLGNPPTVAELIRPERLTPEQMDWMPSIDVSGTDRIYVGPVHGPLPPVGPPLVVRSGDPEALSAALAAAGPAGVLSVPPGVSVPPQRDGSADYTHPPYQPRHRRQLRPERTTG